MDSETLKKLKSVKVKSSGVQRNKEKGARMLKALNEGQDWVRIKDHKTGQETNVLDYHAKELSKNKKATIVET